MRGPATIIIKPDRVTARGPPIADAPTNPGHLPLPGDPAPSQIRVPRLRVPQGAGEGEEGLFPS